jgi:hypothetical protein
MAHARKACAFVSPARTRRRHRILSGPRARARQPSRWTPDRLLAEY